MPRSWHFGAGEALSRTFAFFGRHLPVLCLFAFLLFLPRALYQLHCAGAVWEGGVGDPFFAPASFWTRLEEEAGWIGKLLDHSLPLVLQATVTLGVFQHLRGQRVRFARSFGRGMSRLLPVVGVALLIGLLMLAVVFVGSLLLAAVFTVLWSGVAVVALVLLPLLALMAVIACVFFVSVQVVVVEGVGPAKAMSRSARLTAGARSKILGILLGVLAITLVLDLLARGGFTYRPSSLADARTRILIGTGLDAIAAVFVAVCTAVVYHDLRKAKEGVGIEELLKVFE